MKLGRPWWRYVSDREEVTREKLIVRRGEIIGNEEFGRERSGLDYCYGYVGGYLFLVAKKVGGHFFTYLGRKLDY